MIAQLALPGFPLPPDAVRQDRCEPAPTAPARERPDAWQEHNFFRDRRRDETLFRYAWRSRTKEVEACNRSRFIHLLESAGIRQIAVNGANDPVDLAINGWPVELKIANNHARRRHYYQFKLRRSQKLGAAFVACVCVVPAGGCAELCPFIIPLSACGDRATIDITSEPWAYAGQWAEYRGAYHLLLQGA